MSRSATSTLRTMAARRVATSAVSGSSSAAMRMRASGLRRSCDTPASSNERSLSWRARRSASATQAASIAAISSVGSPSLTIAGADLASCDSMRRRRFSSGRVSRRASAQLAALTTANPSTSATSRRRNTYDSTTSSCRPSQRVRPSGPATSIQVTACGTPRVNTTSPAGTPSSRSVERSVTMRGAQRLDGMAPAGRVSLTRTSSVAGALEAATP